ncbi:MAG: hypothetical protein R3B93_12015 [Bacteroidia bacterium]
MHYLIHSYDDPGHAALALKAADSYAKVTLMPVMPYTCRPHIYVAMNVG